MKETPILMCGEMVRATLDESKTQTRRIVNPQPCGAYVKSGPPDLQGCYYDNEYWKAPGYSGIGTKPLLCPYGIPKHSAKPESDRLWVKETHAFFALDFNETGTWHPTDRDVCCHYRQGCPSEMEDRIGKWRPSIFMPRWASRITLEITGVRVERVREITAADVLKEGVRVPASEDGKMLVRLTGKFHQYLPKGKSIKEATVDEWLVAHYASLWESLNGNGSWAANPWVWVVEFKRL